MNTQSLVIATILSKSAHSQKHGYVPFHHQAALDAFAIRGHRIVALNLSDPMFFERLGRLAKRRDAVLYLGAMFDLHLKEGRETPIFLSDMIGLPAFGLLADHPFSEFIVPRISTFSSRLYLMSQEPGHGEALACMRPNYTRFRILPPLPGPLIDPATHTPPDAAAKSIDVLVAMDMRRPAASLAIIGESARRLGLPESLPATIFDALIENYADHPFGVFRRLVEERLGESLDAIRKSSTSRFLALLRILHHVDMRIRADRRLNLLEALRLEAFPGRVVFLDEPFDGCPAGPQTQFLGSVPTARYLELLASARLCLFANPTYPSMIDQRVPTALVSGCGILSNECAPLRALFSEDEGVVVADGARSLAEIFDQVTDGFAERIQCGRARLHSILADHHPVDAMIDLFRRGLTAAA